MKKIVERKKHIAAQYIATVAVMSALLTVSKLALSFIPNVELVTLLIIVYGSALGASYALPATIIFCLVEMAIYGFGSWTLLYFVYWPLLALLASALLRGKLAVLATILGVIGSVAFGALSAACDTLFVAASLAPSKLGAYFVVYYVRGMYFDIVHTASSLVTVAVLYLPLVRVLSRAVPFASAKHKLGLGRKLNIDLEYFRDPCI